MFVNWSTVNEAVLFDRLKAQVLAHDPWPTTKMGSGPYDPLTPWVGLGSNYQCVYIRHHYNIRLNVYESYGLITRMIATLAEQWWQTKQGIGSQMLIHYTEESRECTKEKEIGKHIKGGTSLNIEDGKKMMITGLESSWSEGMLGIEEESSGDELLQMEMGTSGIGSNLKRKALEDGSASASGAQPSQPAKAPPVQQPPAKAQRLSRKEKEAQAKAEKLAAKEKAKEERALAQILAKEKEEEEQRQAEALAKAELGNSNCLRRQCLRRQ